MGSLGIVLLPSDLQGCSKAQDPVAQAWRSKALRCQEQRFRVHFGSLYPPQSFSKMLHNFSEQGHMECLHLALRPDVLGVLHSWWRVFSSFLFIALEELITTPRRPLTSGFCSGEPRVSPGSLGREGGLLCSVMESQCWEQGCFCLIFFFFQ